MESSSFHLMKRNEWKSFATIWSNTHQYGFYLIVLYQARWDFHSPQEEHPIQPRNPQSISDISFDNFEWPPLILREQMMWRKLDACDVAYGHCRIVSFVVGRFRSMGASRNLSISKLSTVTIISCSTRSKPKSCSRPIRLLGANICAWLCWFRRSDGIVQAKASMSRGW